MDLSDAAPGDDRYDARAGPGGQGTVADRRIDCGESGFAEGRRYHFIKRAAAGFDRGCELGFASFAGSRLTRSASETRQRGKIHEDYLAGRLAVSVRYFAACWHLGNASHGFGRFAFGRTFRRR